VDGADHNYRRPADADAMIAAAVGHIIVGGAADGG
jgi:hypothetical protein